MTGTRSTANHVRDLARLYLTQRAELYGDEFMLDTLEKAKVLGNEYDSLEAFHRKIENCQKCRLSQNRTRFVFGTGNPNANLMCIGEGPGVEEDREGEPFVGKAGQLLNKILGSIGFQRQEVYIANIVKCRPPGNRDPEPDEIRECMPYLKTQINFIQPKVVLALGRVAAQTLLNVDAPLGSLRGKVHNFERAKLVVTYHPAALLRNPQWKRKVWDDVKKARAIYDQDVGDKPRMDFK